MGIRPLFYFTWLSHFYLTLVCKGSSSTAIIEDSFSFLLIHPLFVLWFYPQCLLRGFVLAFILFCGLATLFKTLFKFLLRSCPLFYGFIHCFSAVVLSTVCWRIRLPSFIGDPSPLLLCAFVHCYCLFYFGIKRKLLRRPCVWQAFLASYFDFCWFIHCLCCGFTHSVYCGDSFFLWLSYFIQEFCVRIRPTLFLLRICPLFYGFVHTFYAVVLSTVSSYFDFAFSN